MQMNKRISYIRNNIKSHNMLWNQEIFISHTISKFTMVKGYSTVSSTVEETRRTDKKESNHFFQGIVDKGFLTVKMYFSAMLLPLDPQ